MNPNESRPQTHLVRIRAFLVRGDQEVFGDRSYFRTVTVSAATLPAIAANLNQLLEQIAVEHQQERAAGEYRLELRDVATQQLIMDWRYVPEPVWWEA